MYYVKNMLLTHSVFISFNRFEYKRSTKEPRRMKPRIDIGLCPLPSRNRNTIYISFLFLFSILIFTLHRVEIRS